MDTLACSYLGCWEGCLSEHGRAGIPVVRLRTLQMHGHAGIPVVRLRTFQMHA